MTPLASILLNKGNDMELRIQAAATLISLDQLPQDPSVVLPVLAAAITTECDSEICMIGLARMIKKLKVPSSMANLFSQDDVSTLGTPRDDGSTIKEHVSQYDDGVCYEIGLIYRGAG